MYRLASTVTVRAAVSVRLNVAVSVLSVVVEPGTPFTSQFPELLHVPDALTFQLAEDACAAFPAKATKTAQAAMKLEMRDRVGKTLGALFFMAYLN